MDKLRLVIWFGGIGADCRAFDRAKIGHHIVDCVELDKHAVKSFNLLNGTSFEPKDINDVNVNGYGEVDMLVAGGPCQDLSIAGKQKGLIDGERSSLIGTTIRKINEMKEKPKVILLENVKGLLSEKNKEGFAFIRESFENMGYYFSYKLLNSKFFGVPQNRERVYCVLTLDEPFDGSGSDKFNTVDVKIRDILDKEAEWMIAENFVELGKYGYINATKKQLELKSSYKRYGNVEDDYIGAATASSPPKIYFQNKLSQYKDRLVEVNLNKLYNQDSQEINRVGDCDKEGKILKQEKFQIFYRNLTSSECGKLMGFTEQEFSKVKGHVSNNQLCKQAGNSIVVNVLVEIFKELYKNVL